MDRRGQQLREAMSAEAIARAFCEQCFGLLAGFILRTNETPFTEAKSAEGKSRPH